MSNKLIRVLARLINTLSKQSFSNYSNTEFFSAKGSRTKRIIAILFIFFTTYGFAKEVYDMAGRKVDIPQNVQRVYSSAPPMTLLQYIIAPQTIIAMTIPINSHFYANKNSYLDKSLESVPVVGGWHGNTKGANMETLLALKPQLVLGWRDSFVMKDVEMAFKPYNIPVFFIAEDSVKDEPSAIRAVGRALSMEATAEILAKDAEVRLAYVKNIADKVPNKPVVYYAEGIDGLASECDSSFHFDPIKFVGVKAALECTQKSMMGMEKVNIEEVIKINPDIIIAQESQFYKSVKNDPKWQNIKAVKNNKIFLVPNEPINFIDRPPSFMRIIGVEWLSFVIHPEYFKKDIKQEIKTFYKLYLKVDLNSTQIDSILKSETRLKD